MHAVTAKQEAVVLSYRLGGVVQAHLGLDAERADQDVRPVAATLPNMVFGQQGQAVAAEAVGAGVTDMQHMRDAPAQHQRGEGASHPHQPGIALALRVDPAVERIQHDGGCAPHFHRLRQVAKTVEKTAHGDLGRLAAALRASDSI